MTESKFFVIHKKLQKFIRALNLTSLSRASGFRLYWLEELGKGRAPIGTLRKMINFNQDSSWNRAFRGSRMLIAGKQNFHSAKRKNHAGGKEKSLEVVHRDLCKYKSMSAGSKCERYLEANFFWKSFLQQALKDKKSAKAVWAKSSGETIPKFSRGFKDNSMEECKGTSAKSTPRDSDFQGSRGTEFASTGTLAESKELERVLTSLSGGAAPPAKAAAADAWRTVETKGPEADEMMLPPPQRCRLSCPLPPPEFNPPEPKEFLPEARARLTRFAGGRPHRSSVGSATADSLPEADHSKTKNRNDFALFQIEAKKSSSVDPSDWRLLPAVKSKKVYPSRVNKAQVFDSQAEPIPKMKALLFTPDSLALEYLPVDAPTKIRKDEILVQVTYSGVSTTDLFITEGKMSCGTSPLILGHEISGKVYAAGSDVHQVKKGENVVVNPYDACFTCRYCTMGIFSCCLNEGLDNSIGVSKNGGWAEYVVVKKTQVHKVPIELGLDQAALIHPLSCVVSAMHKLNISPGTSVLIQGLGLAGRLWASVLHVQGHRNVFASDRSRRNRARFQALNLGYPFVDSEEMAKFRADVVVECTGSPASIEKSLKLLNPNGQMCLFGKPSPATEIRCMPYEIVRKELRLLGSIGNAFCFTKAVELAATMGYRYLDFDKMGVRVFDLEEYRHAFHLKKSGEVGKIMFKFES